MDNLELNQDLEEDIEVCKQLLANTMPQRMIDQFVEITQQQQGYQTIAVEQLNDLQLESEDILIQYRELVILKKYLTKYDLDEQEDLAIGIVNAQTIIPKLIYLLNANKIPLIQYDVLWILGNLATLGSFDKLIIQNDGLRIILQKLNSTYQQITLQAIWTLGNITIDGELSQICRNQVRQNGGVDLILQTLKSLKDPKQIEQCLWSLSNICSDGLSYLSKETIQQLIFQICSLLNIFENEVLMLSLLQFLSENIPSSYEFHLQLVNNNIITKLQNLVFHQNRNIRKMSFKIMNNLVESGGEVCDKVLSFKYLHVITIILQNKVFKQQYQQDILSPVLFLCKGTEHQQKAIMEYEIIIQEIFQQLATERSNRLKLIISSLACLALSKDKDVILILIKNQIIPNFINLFQKALDTIQYIEILKGLLNIFQVIKNDVLDLKIQNLITESELNKIKEKFQSDQNNEIRKYVDQIIKYLQ